MRYPKFLKNKATIGLVAPSFGAGTEPYFSRLKSAIDFFENEGYTLKVSPNAFKLEKAESAVAKIRAKEIMDYYLDDNIDFLLSVSGGERMIEILPYLDFEKLCKATPKFYQGYSDNTNFVFTLTTICDVATIYGAHAPSFGMKPLDDSLIENLEILKKERDSQENYDYYEIEGTKGLPNQMLDPYNKVHSVEYKYYNTSKEVEIKGRLLGGCLDILVHLVGTNFDRVKEFNEKYKDDGILWYLEVADLTTAGIIRSLWQLKQAGWFENAVGFIFGRYYSQEPYFGLEYEEAILNVLKDENKPIIIGADIGHLPPTWTIINGALAHFISTPKKKEIKYILK